MSSTLERTFATYWRALAPDDPDYTPEYRWAAHASGGPGKGLRKRLILAGLKDWRFDCAWPEHKVAVELEGGTYTHGRHTRGAGYRNDCDKYNVAQLHGWLVLRYTADMLSDDPIRVVTQVCWALALRAASVEKAKAA